MVNARNGGETNHVRITYRARFELCSPQALVSESVSATRRGRTGKIGGAALPLSPPASRSATSPALCDVAEGRKAASTRRGHGVRHQGRAKLRRAVAAWREGASP